MNEEEFHTALAANDAERLKLVAEQTEVLRRNGDLIETLAGVLAPQVESEEAFNARKQEHEKLKLQDKRDWFAGLALQGMLAAADAACENYAEAAHYAYTYADAMMAERSKP